MEAHEPRMTHSSFASKDIDDLKPIINKTASDSAALDSTIELLVKTKEICQWLN